MGQGRLWPVCCLVAGTCRVRPSPERVLCHADTATEVIIALKTQLNPIMQKLNYVR